MKVQKAYDEFLMDRQVYCSPSTIRTYMGHLKNYLIWLEKMYGTGTDFDNIPEEDNIISLYILHLKKVNPAIRNVTIRSYVRCIKAFLRFCYDLDYCRDYMKRLKVPKDDSAPKQPLYQDEVNRIDACFDKSADKGLRNYCIFHLMLDCGFRSQEVRHLQVEDLQPDRNIVYIKDSKGRKSRFTLCPDFVFDAIRNYMHMSGITSGYIFRSLKNGEPLTQNAVKQLFQNLKAESGVNRLHAHLLRHTFATSFLIGGGNLEFLRVFMGHYDYSVTQNYTQIAAQCKMLGADIYRLDAIFFTRGY